MSNKGIMKKVYIVQSRKNLVVYGCFETNDKAMKYINGQTEKFAIIETDVI